MKKKSKRRTASAVDGRRKKRARPVPKWLKQQQDIDEAARRRCLMILSVLSGEKPVTDAIKEAQISRPLYYQLEERALNAMLRALAPGASPEQTASAGAVKRAQELETRVERLEQDKRRADRLLLLTRKLVKTGPLQISGIRAPRKSKNSQAGKKPAATLTRPSKLSSGSPDSSTAPTTPTPTPPVASTRSKAGEAGP